MGAGRADRRDLRVPAQLRRPRPGPHRVDIAATIIFFTGLFLLSLTVGRRFRLGHPDTATLVFTATARNSESVIGVAAVAFAGHPLVLVAILLGPVVELPAMLALSRLMLTLRTRLHWPDTGQQQPAPAASRT